LRPGFPFPRCVGGAGGCPLGNALERVIAGIEHIELELMGVIAVIGGIVWLVKLRRDRRRYGDGKIEAP
jgi:hypothetical protein